MKPSHPWLRASLALALLAWSSCHAQILIGQTVGVTGSAAATVQEASQGASLYLDHVNAKGGVGGQKIELLTLDDKFDTKLTLDNARVLIEQKGVLGLFMTRGTPHTQGILPLLEQHGVPLVGPSTGAIALHKPVHKYVFNVRAPYQHEVEKAISHLNTLGIKRIGVVHVDDTFNVMAASGTLGKILPQSSLRMHPMLSRALSQSPGSADAFAGWARWLASAWSKTSIVCAAHSAVRELPAGGFKKEVEDALAKVSGILDGHRKRYG